MTIADTVLMIRPKHFGFNAETAASNAFQSASTVADVQMKALREFDWFVEKLRAAGIEVIVVEDTDSPVKPDAIFPNNWASYHADGKVILYPMMAKNRRAERRRDIIDALRTKYQVNEIIDLSACEQQAKFLESTGSIVFDHANKKAYACISPRTDAELLQSVCGELNYEAVTFTALDRSRKEIYHTNVMMNIAEGFAVVCAEAIVEGDRSRVVSLLEKDKKELIDISILQMERFAGNMLCLQNSKKENQLVLSQTAFESLNADQLEMLARHARLLPISIPTIEKTGGGSVRCMMTEIFLPRKKDS